MSASHRNGRVPPGCGAADELGAEQQLTLSELVLARLLEGRWRDVTDRHLALLPPLHRLQATGCRDRLLDRAQAHADPLLGALAPVLTKVEVQRPLDEYLAGWQQDTGGQRRGGREANVPLIYSAKELLAMRFDPKRDVLPGMVPEGLSLLVGRAKLGKSLIALQHAVAVATGGTVLGAAETAVEPGAALYLDLENGKRRAQSRLELMLGAAGADAVRGALDIAVRWPNWDDGGLDWLRAYAEEHPGLRLIVVDTLKRVRPRERGSNGRLYDLDYDALAPLADFAHDRPGLGVEVIHHTKKGDASDILDLASGSTGLTAAVDAVLVWRRARSRPEGKLHVTDRDGEDIQHLLAWDTALNGWRWTGTVPADDDASGDGTGAGRAPGSGAATPPSDERAAVVTVLTEAATPLSPKEIAAATRRTTDATRVLLLRMKQSKQVVHATERTADDGPERGSFYALPAVETAGVP